MAIVSTSLDPAVHFAVVDVETSGLSVQRHRLLQVGIVTLDAHGHVTDRWCSYVRPRHRLVFRVGPKRLHGIRRSSLRSAPPAAAVLDEVALRLDGAVVVAHNSAFDLAFLVDAARRSGRTLPIGPSLCTLDMSRRLDPQRTQSHRLGAICERFGVALDHPHDALADADATAAVFSHLLAAHHITTTAQVLAEVHAQSAARAARAARTAGAQFVET